MDAAADLPTSEFEPLLRKALSEDRSGYHRLVNLRAKLAFEHHFKRYESQLLFGGTSTAYRVFIFDGSMSLDILRNIGCQVLFNENFNQNGPRENCVDGRKCVLLYSITSLHRLLRRLNTI
jgi:hypothetical protein